MAASKETKRAPYFLLVLLGVLALVMAILFWGFHNASLSKPAAAFRSSILALISQSDQKLAPLAAAGDRPAAQAALDYFVSNKPPQASKLVYGMALVNSDGEVIAAKVPSHNPQIETYLRMLESKGLRTPEVVSKALKHKRIISARLFLQDGMTLWVVCSPLRHAGKLAGAVLLGFSGDWCQKHQQLTPEEFLSIPF